jgi:hypothetical protein
MASLRLKSSSYAPTKNLNPPYKRLFIRLANTFAMQTPQFSKGHPFTATALRKSNPHTLFELEI